MRLGDSHANVYYYKEGIVECAWTIEEKMQEGNSISGYSTIFQVQSLPIKEMYTKKKYKSTPEKKSNLEKTLVFFLGFEAKD